MREDADDWAHFWDGKSEEWLEGYCFAKDTIWWETDWGFSQHHSYGIGLIYVIDELGEEE